MATTTMTMPGTTSRFAQSRGGLSAISRRSSRSSASQARPISSRRSSTASLTNPEGTQAPSKYLLSQQEAFAASKTKKSFWSRSSSNSSKDVEHDTRADLLSKRVASLRAFLKTIREEYESWQATAVPDDRDTLTQKIEKLSMRFNTSRLAVLARQAHTESVDCAKLIAQWLIGRTNPQKHSWYSKISRVQSEYPTLKHEAEMLLKQIHDYTTARIAQQEEYEREQRVEHTRKNMPRPAFLPGMHKYKARDGSSRYKRVTHELLYERLASDDKRIYMKNGLFYLYTSPSADPTINKLDRVDRWHVRLVLPQTRQQLNTHSKLCNFDASLDVLRNGRWCVRYIERRDHVDPGWLAEVHDLMPMQKDIRIRPPRENTVSDQLYYPRRSSAVWDEAPPEWDDNDENRIPPAPGYTPEYIEGPYRECVKRIERVRRQKLGRPCHVADLVKPAVLVEQNRRIAEQRKTVVKRIERARCRKLGRPCHVADLVDPVLQQAQYELMEYYQKKAERRNRRKQASQW